MKYTSALFFLLFLIIVLPLLQHCFSIVESGKLNGAFASNPDAQFSYVKWWNGDYQQQKSNFLNDSTGFRPDLVRLNNQLDYWLFKKLNGHDIYIGADGFLFSLGHTDEYFGIDRLEPGVVRMELIKLKKIQDTLEHLGKTMVFAYAPSKAYAWPAKIPGCMYPIGDTKTSNYYSFKRIGDSLHINQLDLNAYFMTMADTEKELAFSKQGFHWTIYGALLGGDSITKYIERLRNISMPELTIEEKRYSTVARSPDADLGSVLNLIFPLAAEKYCYPNYNYNSKGGTTKPRTIYICDSYMWPLLYCNYMSNVSSNWECWSYFKDVWNEDCTYGRQTPKQIATYNWQQSLLNTDCVVILFIPWNFPEFQSKEFFLEKMYSYFYPDKELKST